MLCELYTFRHSIFYMMLLGFSCISQLYAPKFLTSASHKRHYITWKTGKEGWRIFFFSIQPGTVLKSQNLCQTAEQNATKKSISLKKNKYFKGKNKVIWKFKLRNSLATLQIAKLAELNIFISPLIRILIVQATYRRKL